MEQWIGIFLLILMAPGLLLLIAVVVGAAIHMKQKPGEVSKALELPKAPPTREPDA